MKQLSIRFLIIGLYFILPTTFGCSSAEDEAPQKTSRPPARAMAVEGFIVNEQSLENIISATGSLLPNELVQISPERAGKIVQLGFKESSYVQKGALLAKIDDQELQAQLNKLVIQEQMAIRESERGKELREIDAIPLEEFERLENTVKEIQADIALTRVQIEKTNIRAPFSGLIGLRNVSLGAYVSPSQSIAPLQQINPLKVEFDVPEKFMREIRTGQKVTFQIVGFNTPFTATIYATSATVNQSTRSFKVMARCANPGRQLKPGNFAKVDVITSVNKHAIMIPSDAVIPVINGQKVFVANAGKVDERLVETGVREGIMIEILSGINPLDTVIVSGLLAVSAGMNVQVSDLVSYDSHLN